MRGRVYEALRLLFKLSVCLCFLTGALLVLTQLAGVALRRPEWIVQGKALFLPPTMVFAVAFGLIGFAASYFQPETAEAADEPSE